MFTNLTNTERWLPETTRVFHANRTVNLNSSSSYEPDTSTPTPSISVYTIDDSDWSETLTSTRSIPVFTLDKSEFTDSLSSSFVSLTAATSSQLSLSSEPTTGAHTKSVSIAYTSSTSLEVLNYTSSITTNTTTPAPTLCTGCVLEAIWPATISFEETQSSAWTSIVVTETVLILTITYMQGTAIDTIITTQETLNQTTTVIGTANQTITHSAPVFTFEPGDGTTLTL